MINRDKFIRFAEDIELSCRAFDKLSEAVGCDVWESDMTVVIDPAIKLLGIAAGVDITKDAVCERLFNPFWANKFLDSVDERYEFWGSIYDDIMEVNKE